MHLIFKIQKRLYNNYLQNKQKAIMKLNDHINNYLNGIMYN